MSKHRRNNRLHYSSWNSFFSPEFCQEKLVENLKKANIFAMRVWSPYDLGSIWWFTDFERNTKEKVILQILYEGSHYLVLKGSKKLIYASVTQSSWTADEQPDLDKRFQKFLKKYRIR